MAGGGRPLAAVATGFLGDPRGVVRHPSVHAGFVLSGTPLAVAHDAYHRPPPPRVQLRDQGAATVALHKPLPPLFTAPTIIISSPQATSYT